MTQRQDFFTRGECKSNQFSAMSIIVGFDLII